MERLRPLLIPVRPGRELATISPMTSPMTTLQAPTDIDAAIDKLLDIIVQGWDPLQIVLFGSRARGDHHEDSDIDLLVVLDECEDWMQARRDIRRALPTQLIPTDVIVTTPTLWLKRACLVGAVERKALIDGRILYVRGGGDPVIEAALHLLQLGLEDLGTADFLLSIESQPPRQACFHAQQAAEKTLKAALELEHNDYPRIHELDELLPQLPPTWPVHELELNLKQLSALVIDARYPDVDKLPTRDDAVEAVADARLVVDSIAAEFQRRGLELR